MPRFAANLTMMFNEHAFLDRFQAAADAGFEAVEFLFPYDHPAELLAEKLQRAGLSQALFNMPPGNWHAGERGLAAVAGREEAFRASVNTALGYAKIIGSPLLHVMAGLADRRDVAAMGRYLDALQFAVDAAADADVGLVIEPINRRDMPGYFLDDFDVALDIIRKIDCPNLRLQFDIYHRQILHGDVIMALRSMMPWIAHIQVASVPKRNEPGTGELNDALIFSEIDALGYDGFVGCEYRPAGRTEDGLSWLKAW